MRERYTLGLASGHRVKIKKGDAYEVTFDDVKLSFEEHPRTKNLGVHTHVWVEVIDDPETTRDIYNYVLWQLEKYPRKTTALALVVGWEPDEEKKEWEGPYVLYELIIKRKFSQTLINDIKFWALEIYDIVSGYVAMRSLFGDKVEF